VVLTLTKEEPTMPTTCPFPTCPETDAELQAIPACAACTAELAADVMASTDDYYDEFSDPEGSELWPF
jgi:hypothetical protein